MTDQVTGHLTAEELAALMKQTAGITVAPQDLKQQADSEFTTFGLDSLGLLGIVGELEKRYGRNLPDRVEKCKTPREFLTSVNDFLAEGV